MYVWHRNHRLLHLQRKYFQSFHLPVYNRAGEVLTLRHLESQLRKVLAQSDTTNPHPINVVSSDDRDKWAEVYERVRGK